MKCVSICVCAAMLKIQPFTAFELSLSAELKKGIRRGRRAQKNRNNADFAYLVTIMKDYVKKGEEI